MRPIADRICPASPQHPPKAAKAEVTRPAGAHRSESVAGRAPDASAGVRRRLCRDYTQVEK
ncbi:hypothetical protein GCM10022245_44460 [Streptomyces mayteni]